MKNLFLTRFSGYIKFSRSTKQDGYTLIEVLVVVVMVGILSAIAAPSWVSFTNNQRLRTAQGQVYSAMNEARSIAKSKKIGFQISFRENNTGILQYAVHPTATRPTTAAGWDGLAWQNLNFVGMAQISPEADFNRPGLDDEPFNLETDAAPTIVLSIRFSSKGELLDFGQPSVKIGVKGGGGVYGKRACVTVTTLLGAIRNLNEGDPGKACD